MAECQNNAALEQCWALSCASRQRKAAARMPFPAASVVCRAGRLSHGAARRGDDAWRASRDERDAQRGRPRKASPICTAPSDAEDAARQDEARRAAWWRNLEQHYRGLSDRLGERAQLWRDRFAQRAEWLRSWFGDAGAESVTVPPDASAEPSQAAGLPEATQPEPER